MLLRRHPGNLKPSDAIMAAIRPAPSSREEVGVHLHPGSSLRHLWPSTFNTILFFASELFSALLSSLQFGERRRVVLSDKMIPSWPFVYPFLQPIYFRDTKHDCLGVLGVIVWLLSLVHPPDPPGLVGGNPWLSNVPTFPKQPILITVQGNLFKFVSLPHYYLKAI